MRKMFVAGNWKMNTGFEEAIRLAENISANIGDTPVQTVIIPPFPWIVPVSEVVTGSAVTVGTQNIFYAEAGAYTGEVSVEMIAPFCTHAVIGHSERRHILGETDEIVAKKVNAALAGGLEPILCVGETLEEHDAGSAQDVVNKQLHAVFDSLPMAVSGSVVIAYEPVWAIGTGKAASAEDAQEMAAFIRSTLTSLMGDEKAQATRIQYGGSVKPDNASSFFAMPDIDGALVGGACLVADDFLAIIRAAEAASNC